MYNETRSFTQLTGNENIEELWAMCKTVAPGQLIEAKKKVTQSLDRLMKVLGNKDDKN